MVLFAVIARLRFFHRKSLHYNEGLAHQHGSGVLGASLNLLTDVFQRGLRSNFHPPWVALGTLRTFEISTGLLNDHEDSGTIV